MAQAGGRFTKAVGLGPKLARFDRFRMSAIRSLLGANRTSRQSQNGANDPYETWAGDKRLQNPCCLTLLGHRPHRCAAIWYASRRITQVGSQINVTSRRH